MSIRTRPRPTRRRSRTSWRRSGSSPEPRYPLGRRGGRAVEGSALEKRRVARSRGFESHPLRHDVTPSSTGQAMTAPSASTLPTLERSPVLVWSVVALQVFLLFELVVRVQTDVSSSTEGMVGYGVMWAGVYAVLILGSTIAWILGRVWPIVVVN